MKSSISHTWCAGVCMLLVASLQLSSYELYSESQYTLSEPTNRAVEEYLQRTLHLIYYDRLFIFKFILNVSIGQCDLVSCELRCINF